MLFFFPAKVQVVVGIVLLVVGIAVLHSFITAGLGVLGLAFGTARYVRSRRSNAFQR
jgi:hypothetical protein